jgi:hypothetical protein
VFLSGNKGYIGTGSLESLFVKDFWGSMMCNDIWTRKADLEEREDMSQPDFPLAAKDTIGWEMMVAIQKICGHISEVQTPGTGSYGKHEHRACLLHRNPAKKWKGTCNRGSNASNALASAELYDPATSTW